MKGVRDGDIRPPKGPVVVEPTISTHTSSRLVFLGLLTEEPLRVLGEASTLRTNLPSPVSCYPSGSTEYEAMVNCLGEVPMTRGSWNYSVPLGSHFSYLFVVR